MRTLFSTVLNMSLTASFVILAVLAVRFLLRKAPRRFSYALWAAVLFRLLCPIALESPLSLLPTSQPLAAVEQAVRPNTPTVPNGTSTVPNAPGAPAAPTPEPAAEPAAANPVPALTVPGSASAAVPGDTPTAVSPAPAAVDPVTVAAAVWLCGAGALAAYSAVSLLRLRRRLVGAVPVGDGVWLADHIPTPFVLGLVRPRIYLPSTLPAGERDYILLHERTHIRRGDHIVKALAFAALAVHWFNPLVWLAFHLAGRDMEMSCDEAVLGRMGRDVRADYSSSLLRLSAGRRLPVGPLAFGDGDPQRRIKNVMNYKKPAFWVVALAVAAVAACCVALFTNPARRSELGSRGEELTFCYAGDRCLYIFGSHYPDITLRWYFPSEHPSESDPTPLALGNLFFNDLSLSGGTSKMGVAFWTGEKRNAVKFNLLRFGEEDVSLNFTVALSETGGTIIEQEVWKHPELEFPLPDDEVIALAQDFACYIREAEAHYASGDYTVVSPVDLSDLSAELEFLADDNEDHLLPNIRITGTVNGHEFGRDSFPGDRVFWYPYEYGDRYPLGQLSFPRCSLQEIEGRETLCATWTSEYHTAIRLDNSFSAMISSQFDQKWYDVTVILSEQGGSVMERNTYGSGGTVTELSDEEAVALARFAAKLLTEAEGYYDNSGLDWSDRYQLWSEDLALRKKSSDQSAAQWDETLAPYAPFGLTWEFNDPDLDGNGLTMWFDGQVVRGIVDEEKGLWITEHTGSNYPEGAVEVFAIRRNGELTGLRAATAEEQSQYDLMRQKNAGADPSCTLPVPLPFNQRVTMEFLSGAGGWATVLHLDPDGHFEGEYHDSDMGVTGSGYDSTMYLCQFYGQFGDITQLSDNSWSLTLKELTLNTGVPMGGDYQPLPMGGEFHPLGEEWIDGGVRYISSEPYGFDGKDGKALSPGAQFILYAPGAKGYAPGDELYGANSANEDYESVMYQFWHWWPDRRDWTPGSTLGCYGLCNLATGQGFFSENAFSWEKDYAAYAGQPGVKLSGFAHPEGLPGQAMGDRMPFGWLLEEVTVDWDNMQQYYDWNSGMIRYDFFSYDTVGGGESVYMDFSGKTHMIVYGE